MKIALISFYSFSLSIRSLSSFLKKNGHECYNLYYCNPLITEKDLQITTSFLKSLNPGLIGLSVLTDDFEKAKILSLKIKDETTIPIIWGGIHVSLAPEECIQFADFLCINEGEGALAELCNSIESKTDYRKIKNLWIIEHKTIIKNELRPFIEDLDTLPMPDLTLNTQYIYRESDYSLIRNKDLGFRYDIMGSRGCPFGCSYCYNIRNNISLKHLGKYFRSRSNWNIIEEIRMALKVNPSIKGIYFLDDVFLDMDYKKISAFCETYIKTINLPFFCMGHPNLIKENIIKKLSLAGLIQMQIGIQSGSESIRHNIYNRHHSNNRILDITGLLHKYNVLPKLDIILNNPYENSYDIEHSVDLLLKIRKPYVLQGTSLYFMPGCELSNKAIKDGLISKRIKNDYIAEESKLNKIPSHIIDNNIGKRYYQYHFSTKQNDYLNFILLLIEYYPKIFIKIIYKLRLRWLMKFTCLLINFAYAICYHWPFFKKSRIKRLCRDLFNDA